MGSKGVDEYNKDGSLGSGAGSGKALHEGLKRNAPTNRGDRSRTLPTSKTVNANAERSRVGAATNNLGPREA
jgi:hypothetical protein